jgi:aspartate aminotransferase
MSDIPGLQVNKPQGAFYVFPKCSSLFGKKTPKGDVINSAADLAMYLLTEGHVACVGGGAFGAPEYIRMSYATSDENIKKAAQRIKEAIEKLK